MEFPPFVTTSDWKLIRAARKRGSDKAADRVIAAISVGLTAHLHDQLRRAMVADADTDYGWPPAFLKKG